MAAYGYLAVAAIEILCLVWPSPLWAHFLHGNSSVLCILVNTFVLLSIFVVDGFAWAHDNEIRVPRWCDFASALIVAGPTALSAACFSLSVFVVRVIRTSRMRLKLRDKRIHAVWDLGIGFGLPVAVLLLHLCWQPHRFAISTVVGCRPSIAITFPAFFLGLFAPIVLSSFHLFASAFIAYELVRDRHQLEELAAPCADIYSTRWFLRISVVAIALGPACFVLSLLILLDQFRLDGPFTTVIAHDWTIIDQLDLTAVTALEIYPVVIGALTIVLLGPGAETAAAASRFGDVLGLRACFSLTRKRFSHFSSRGTPRKVDLEAEPGLVVNDIETLRRQTQASAAPTYRQSTSSAATVLTQVHAASPPNTPRQSGASSLASFISRPSFDSSKMPTPGRLRLPSQAASKNSRLR